MVYYAPPPPTTTPTATPRTSFVELNLIYYYYLFIYHNIDCDVALLRCRHRQSIRAAATALLPSRCALPPRLALPPCRRHAADKSRWRAAATANVALWRCRNRR
jgi:hypothetical protein